MRGNEHCIFRVLKGQNGGESGVMWKEVKGEAGEVGRCQSVWG